jgi:hypothetical protein
MVAIKPPPRVDRVWVLPGALCLRVHSDRSGVTAALNFREQPITRSHAAKVLRIFRQEYQCRFLKYHANVIK